MPNHIAQCKIKSEKKIQGARDRLKTEVVLGFKDKEISIFKNEADKLTNYAISVRYPEEPLESTLEEAEEAFRMAKKIRRFVLDKVSLK